ncbi:MAG: NMD3-related protein [Thermoplasmata archaeon]
MSGPGEEFCVRCGRTGIPIEEGVCADCFADRRELLGVVDHPRVVLCPSCGARMVGSHWERPGAPTLLDPEDLMPLLLPLPEVTVRSVEWEETGRNPLVREMRAIARIRVRGIERTVAREFEVQLEHRSCPECSRRSGHFYTALVQLRGPEGRSVGGQREARRERRERWDRVIADARSDWRRAMSWEEERPEGYDFYFVDTVQARALARWMKQRLRATLSESPTLYGRKDGQDLYRVTFCLRLPDPPAPPGRVPLGRPPSHRALRFRQGRGRLERQP